MSDFKEINITELTASPYNLFNKDWALLTAGNSEKRSRGCEKVTAGGTGIRWKYFDGWCRSGFLKRFLCGKYRRIALAVKGIRKNFFQIWFPYKSDCRSEHIPQRNRYFRFFRNGDRGIRSRNRGYGDI